MTTATVTQERVRSVLDRRNLLTALPAILLVVLVLAISARQPTFLSPLSLRTVAESTAPIAILALGQSLVILTGGIDLSIAVLASLGTVLLATWIGDMGATAVVLMILLITGAGFVNGFVAAFAQVPSFVVTLGGMGLWAGVALVISGASTLPISENYQLIGWITGKRVGGLSFAVYLALFLAIVVALAMKFLSRGRALHFVGLAESAALMSGLRTRNVRVLAFTLSGFFAAIAAVVFSSSQYSGAPTLASALLLPAIASVVVGGSAITGGIGGPFRTLIGALVIGVLRVGLPILGVDPAFEQVVYGALVISAVALTVDRSRIGIVK